MYFSKRTKTGPTRDPIPHHNSKKKEGAQIWPQRRKTLPPIRKRAKKGHRGKVIPPTQTAFFYLEKYTQEKITFYSPVDSTPIHAWTSIRANLIRKPIPP